MAITVPTKGSTIDADTFGKPVADQLNAIAPTGWTTLALTNGATASGGRVVQWRKIGDNVQIRGHVITTGTTVLATLPSSCFPVYNLEFPVSLFTGARVAGVLLINTAGQLSLYDAAGNAGLYVMYSTLNI